MSFLARAWRSNGPFGPEYRLNRAAALTIFDLGGLFVTLVGDLKHSRTIHSFAKALALRPNTRIACVSSEEFALPEELRKHLTHKGIEHSHHATMSDEIISKTDVVYMTRMQAERHDPQQHSQHFDLSAPQEYSQQVITPEVLAKAKEKMLILHPLPRGPEISRTIDNDPRAAYMRQMGNGPYVRMALLQSMLLG